jgi:hypothetical protein
MIDSGDFFYFRISTVISGTDFLIVMFSVFKTCVSSRLQSRRSRNSDFISGRCNAFFISKRSYLLSSTRRVHSSGYWKSLPEVKPSWPEGDYSSLCNAEVQKSWSLTSTLLIRYVSFQHYQCQEQLLKLHIINSHLTGFYLVHSEAWYLDFSTALFTFKMPFGFTAHA